ncbi:PhzF family phenazine biosynthesis isomerase, partial [Gammaproteobacteria bacterium]|nr:PhzF family phenazine biosynthesis isomerase [Gammaproteobacteria bacterium]
MKLSIYYIDAFTKSLFSGNPAAVIFSNLDNPKVMQNIAAENNLSETAFISYRDNKYFIRWFAPECEIDLCGHATLASAHVFFNYI